MRCDPSRARLEKFERHYPFRYYSSFSQPHCFSERLNVFQLALGPGIILRQEDHACFTCVSDKMRASQFNSILPLTFTQAQARLLPGKAMLHLLRTSSTPSTPRCHSLHDPFGIYRINCSTWDHMLIFLGENGMDDAFSRVPFAKVLACVCTVTIHMTGRHYGLFLLN